MTTSTKGFKIGFRYLSFFKLNTTTLLPDATSASVPYEGLNYESARSMTVNVPQPRKIEHQGDDRVESLDFLPPSSAIDAEIHVGMSNLDIVAALSGILVDNTVGTSNFISLATDQQGLEPFVSIQAYSQATDWPLGNRTWHWYWFPYARTIYAPAGMAETPQDILFRVAPQFITTLPWGLPLSESINGTLTGQGLEGISEGRPHLACWKAGVSTTAYAFDTAHPAYSTASIEVYVITAGTCVKVTPGLSSVTGFTISAPAQNAIVCAWYEE